MAAEKTTKKPTKDEYRACLGVANMGLCQSTQTKQLNDITPQTEPHKRHLKLLLLGSGFVGKSTLFNYLKYSYVQQFDPQNDQIKESQIETVKLYHIKQTDTY